MPHNLISDQCLYCFLNIVFSPMVIELRKVGRYQQQYDSRLNQAYDRKACLQSL